MSCGGDESNDDPTYSFADQDVEGIIDGQPFNFGEGSARDSPFNEEMLSIKLFDQNEDIADICIFFEAGNEVSVLFDIPNEVGFYELALGSRTVTLYNPDTERNSLAVFGAVEILNITSTQVTGRIDAQADSQSQINGYFTVELCPTN